MPTLQIWRLWTATSRRCSARHSAPTLRRISCNLYLSTNLKATPSNWPKKPWWSCRVSCSAIWESGESHHYPRPKCKGSRFRNSYLWKRQFSPAWSRGTSCRLKRGSFKKLKKWVWTCLEFRTLLRPTACVKTASRWFLTKWTTQTTETCSSLLHSSRPRFCSSFSSRTQWWALLQARSKASTFSSKWWWVRSLKISANSKCTRRINSSRCTSRIQWWIWWQAKCKETCRSKQAQQLTGTLILAKSDYL